MARIIPRPSIHSNDALYSLEGGAFPMFDPTICVMPAPAIAPTLLKLISNHQQDG
jgi:hypothetical protein